MLRMPGFQRGGACSQHLQPSYSGLQDELERVARGEMGQRNIRQMGRHGSLAADLGIMVAGQDDHPVCQAAAERAFQDLPVHVVAGHHAAGHQQVAHIQAAGEVVPQRECHRRHLRRHHCQGVNQVPVPRIDELVHVQVQHPIRLERVVRDPVKQGVVFLLVEENGAGPHDGQRHALLPQGLQYLQRAVAAAIVQQQDALRVGHVVAYERLDDIVLVQHPCHHHDAHRHVSGVAQ